MATTMNRDSVLVVEDNEDIVLGLQDLLHHDGYAVTVAGTVAGAIELVRTHRFNAILLDLGLPDGDGLDVLTETHRLDPSLPVIIVTAHIARDRTVGSLSEGAFAYLTKPYDREELRHTLRRAIGVKELAVKVERTEHLLSQSEERFRSLVSNLPGAVYRCACDSDWTMEFLSDPIEQLCGYPTSDFLASRVRSYGSVIHPNDRQIVERGVLGAVAQRRPYDIEYRLLHKDGGIRWVYEKGQGVFTADGQILWLDGAIFDITDRKQTEDTRARLASIIESSDNAIISKDLNGVITTWNQGAQRLFGYTEQEVIGRPVSILIPPDREDEELRILERISGGESTDHFETVRRRKDGSLVDVSLIVSPIKDAQGQVIGASKIAHDITERKRMEGALRRSERLLQDIINNTTAVIYVKDTDGRYLLINRRFEYLFHLTMGQIVGRTDHDIFPKDIADAFRANDVAVLERNRVVEYEEYAPHSDGLHTYISIKFPLYDHRGEPYATCGISTDITERKRIEDALHASDRRPRLALTATPVGLWDWDLQTGQLYWSPDVDTLLGMAPGSVRGTQGALLALVHPDDREPVALAMHHAMESPHDDVRFEHHALQPDGSVQWCIWTGKVIRDREGHAVHILGTVHATADSNP